MFNFEEFSKRFAHIDKKTIDKTFCGHYKFSNCLKLCNEQLQVYYKIKIYQRIHEPKPIDLGPNRKIEDIGLFRAE